MSSSWKGARSEQVFRPNDGEFLTTSEATRRAAEPSLPQSGQGAAMNRHGSATGACCLPQLRPERARRLGPCGLRDDLRLLFLKERSKLISPTEVTRMNLLKHHELLACRCRIAPKLCQEVNNAALLGDLLFRDIQLSNSLNEIVHDDFTIHLPHAP
jgi:hypothetical protein